MMDKPITSNGKTGLETCLRTAVLKSNRFTLKIFIFIGCKIKTGGLAPDISRQHNVTHFQGPNIHVHSLAFQLLKMRPLHLKIPWSSNKRYQKPAPLKTKQQLCSIRIYDLRLEQYRQIHNRHSEHYQVNHHPLFLEEKGVNNEENSSDTEEDDKIHAIFWKVHTGLIHILHHFC